MKKKKIEASQIVLHIMLSLLCLTYILPFMLLVSISFSSESAIREFGYTFIPKVFSVEAYKQIFNNPTSLINAYKTTTIFSALTTALSIIIMGMMAYPLARKNCNFRKPLSFFIFFTMLFSGGLIPSYIINTNVLHLNNTIWIYILPSLVSAWYIIIIRTFYQGLPTEMIEATKIDGASEITVFTRIIAPLSLPSYATIGFLVLLAKWNDWNTTLIYIDNIELYSLQYLLQKILREAEFLNKVATDGTGLFQNQEVPTESMRYAMAILAAGPMLVVFPFFQKYFTKGMTIGAVKG